MLQELTLEFLKDCMTCTMAETVSYNAAISACVEKGLSTLRDHHCAVGGHGLVLDIYGSMLLLSCRPPAMTGFGLTRPATGQR